MRERMHAEVQRHLGPIRGPRQTFAQLLEADPQLAQLIHHCPPDRHGEVDSCSDYHELRPGTVRR
jgi:hypothetical protein